MLDDILKALKEKLGAISDLCSATRLLEWDQETYMPPKAADERAQQLATLSALAHSMFISEEMEKWIETLWEKRAHLSPDDAGLVEIVRYDYQRKKALPESFVHELALVASRALPVWVEARKASDFKRFLPVFEKIVELNRKKADLLGFEDSPYDALLEDYERGITVRQIKRIFSSLAPALSALVNAIVRQKSEVDFSWLSGEWDETGKWAFSLRVLNDLGYDLDAGRQYKSVHPFSTSMGLYDVRITTRTSPQDLFQGLMATIHECGHALYTQGHDPKDQRTPLLDGASLGIHESQSRLWENIVGRSLSFWEHYTSVLREHFPGRLEKVTPYDIYVALNQVTPSLIRVDADECTYNLHVILRFEIELDLIENRLAPRDVPEAWNAKMKRFLDVDVPDDAHGCLQDIHWAHGAFGYFPTYALGNLYAAQFMEKILLDIPDLWEHIAAGSFAPLLCWLREHVHRYNRRKLPSEILMAATGAELDHKPFLNYLDKKFSSLYNLR